MKKSDKPPDKAKDKDPKEPKKKDEHKGPGYFKQSYDFVEELKHAGTEYSKEKESEHHQSHRKSDPDANITNPLLHKASTEHDEAIDQKGQMTMGNKKWKIEYGNVPEGDQKPNTDFRLVAETTQKRGSLNGPKSREEYILGAMYPSPHVTRHGEEDQTAKPTTTEPAADTDKRPEPAPETGKARRRSLVGSPELDSKDLEEVEKFKSKHVVKLLKDAEDNQRREEQAKQQRKRDLNISENSVQQRRMFGYMPGPLPTSFPVKSPAQVPSKGELKPHLTVSEPKSNLVPSITKSRSADIKTIKKLTVNQSVRNLPAGQSLQAVSTQPDKKPVQNAAKSPSRRRQSGTAQNNDIREQSTVSFETRDKLKTTAEGEPLQKNAIPETNIEPVNATGKDTQPTPLTKNPEVSKIPATHEAGPIRTNNVQRKRGSKTLEPNANTEPILGSVKPLESTNQTLPKPGTAPKRISQTIEPQETGQKISSTANDAGSKLDETQKSKRASQNIQPTVPKRISETIEPQETGPKVVSTAIDAESKLEETQKPKRVSRTQPVVPKPEPGEQLNEIQPKQEITSKRGSKSIPPTNAVGQPIPTEVQDSKQPHTSIMIDDEPKVEETRKPKIISKTKQSPAPNPKAIFQTIQSSAPKPKPARIYDSFKSSTDLRGTRFGISPSRAPESINNEVIRDDEAPSTTPRSFIVDAKSKHHSRSKVPAVEPKLEAASTPKRASKTISASTPNTDPNTTVKPMSEVGPNEEVVPKRTSKSMQQSEAKGLQAVQPSDQVSGTVPKPEIVPKPTSNTVKPAIPDSQKTPSGHDEFDQADTDVPPSKTGRPEVNPQSIPKKGTPETEKLKAENGPVEPLKIGKEVQNANPTKNPNESSSVPEKNQGSPVNSQPKRSSLTHKNAELPLQPVTKTDNSIGSTLVSPLETATVKGLVSGKPPQSPKSSLKPIPKDAMNNKTIQPAPIKLDDPLAKIDPTAKEPVVVPKPTTLPPVLKKFQFKLPPLDPTKKDFDPIAADQKKTTNAVNKLFDKHIPTPVHVDEIEQLKDFGIPNQEKPLELLLDDDTIEFDFGGLMREYYSYALRSYCLINMQDRYRGASKFSKCFTSLDVSKIGTKEQEQDKTTERKLKKLEVQMQDLRAVSVDQDHFNYLKNLAHTQPITLPMTILHGITEEMVPVLEDFFRFYGKNLGMDHHCTKKAGIHYVKMRKRVKMYTKISGGSSRIGMMDENDNEY